MRSFIVGLGAFLVTFELAHFVVLNAVPGKIMSKARERIMANGLPMQHWQMTPRVSPENQRVVRPAPDLAYAICVIDLTDGPVELDVPSWNSYGSLSVFSARTDNVYAGSLDARVAGTPEMRRLIVATDQQDVSAAGYAEIVRVGQPEALALIRRLAPTQEAYDAAAALVPDSRCERL